MTFHLSVLSTLLLISISVKQGVLHSALKVSSISLLETVLALISGGVCGEHTSRLINPLLKSGSHATCAKKSRLKKMNIFFMKICLQRQSILTSFKAPNIALLVGSQKLFQLLRCQPLRKARKFPQAFQLRGRKGMFKFRRRRG